MTKFVKWSVQLDMTTKNINFAAFIFDAPSVLDIDQDGKMEIIIGNSVGFIYILDCEGSPMDGWPKQIGSIETRTLVDDFNGDGKIEIIAGPYNNAFFFLYTKINKSFFFFEKR